MHIATSQMSASDLKDAKEAILWFELYFSQQVQSPTQSLAVKNIRKLKYFCKQSRDRNIDAVSQAQEMHFSLELLIDKLKDAVE